MSHRTLFFLVLSASLLIACDREAGEAEVPAAGETQPAAEGAAIEQPEEAPADSGFAQAAVDAAITELDAEDLAKHIETLASDEFGGRAPFTEGERKTLEYLQQQFREAGAQPANGDSYLQAVDLVELTATATDLTLLHADQQWSLAYGEEMMAWTKQVTKQVALEDSELVFVGYGIVAPEYQWNDYEGLDVTGKTVVMLVNDPGYASQDESLFNGNAMTYYGRWTYKYEEAAKQGAAGALIVHQTGAAGYPWEVVSGSWAGAQFDLAAENDNMHRVKVEGWITEDAARKLFETAGQDFEQLAEQAATADFQPVALDTTASIGIDNEIRRNQSYNVAARIPGSERPDEHFIYMAHWDHMGTKESGEVFSGAVDNATGTAALIELTEAFQALPRNPKRSILFLAVTAEESGLLGSAHYAANPLYPLEKTVGGVNIDAMNVVGPTHDVVVIGYGSSELEDYLREAAATQDRELVREPTPEKGFFYRSDHFNFAKHGVPVLYAEAGVEDREHGREHGLAAAEDYIANRYHKPGDKFDPDWNLGGAVEDMELYFHVGLTIAESEDWPNWYEGTEFRAIRDQALSGQ